MRKPSGGFTCQHCGVLFCDRVRQDRQRKFCSKSCSSKYSWSNYTDNMLEGIKSRKSPIFKNATFTCEFCGKDEVKRSTKHRWCDDCVRPGSFKKDRSLLINYNISWREYETMLNKQDNKCLICLTVPKRSNVDHCHKTGKVRGILCSRCNAVLEFIEDSERLSRALNYLGSF